LASIFFLKNVGTTWLSLSGVFYLLPYFVAGIYYSRFPIKIKHKQIIGFVLLMVVVGLLFLYGQYSHERRSILALIIGILSCSGLLFINAKSIFLARIGFYSYEIYLFHVFFTAGSRIVFKPAGISNIYILLIIGIVFGITGPIMISWIAYRYPLTSACLLGKHSRHPL